MSPKLAEIPWRIDKGRTRPTLHARRVPLSPRLSPRCHRPRRRYAVPRFRSSLSLARKTCAAPAAARAPWLPVLPGPPKTSTPLEFEPDGCCAIVIRPDISVGASAGQAALLLVLAPQGRGHFFRPENATNLRHREMVLQTIIGAECRARLPGSGEAIHMYVEWQSRAADRRTNRCSNASPATPRRASSSSSCGHGAHQSCSR